MVCLNISYSLLIIVLPTRRMKINTETKTNCTLHTHTKRMHIVKNLKIFRVFVICIESYICRQFQSLATQNPSKSISNVYFHWVMLIIIGVFFTTINLCYIWEIYVLTRCQCKHFVFSLPCTFCVLSSSSSSLSSLLHSPILCESEFGILT